MKRTVAWVAACLLTLTWATAASAIPPQQMTVQGQLKASGVAASAGDYDITVRFWNAQDAGVMLYTETLTAVAVYDNGLFDVRLGADTTVLAPGVFKDNSQVWMGLTLEAGPGLSAPEPELPRTLMTSVGFAFSASSATTAAMADVASDVACVNGCVSEVELSFDTATQAELDAVQLMVPTSVDGLAGGTLSSALTVSGNVTGTLLCDGDGNCGKATASGCADDQIMRRSGSTWACADIPSDLPAGCLEGQVVMWSGGGFGCGDLPSEVPVTCGDGEYVTWDGSAYVCAAAPTTLPDPPECNGAYEGLQWDGTSWACVAINTTGLSGGGAQGYEVVDPWGYAWDGVMRGAKTWDLAEAECQGLMGRLPTATELFRVNAATGTGGVGDQNATDYLWTRIRYDHSSSPYRHFVFRLSDGASTYYNDTTPRPFRCVWPDRQAMAFEGNQCYGPPGTECWATSAEGARYNMDMYDRPPLNPNGAMQECNFYNAHLSSFGMLTEEVQSGLPNGSNAWLWTSDHLGYNGTQFLLSIVRWTGIETGFSAEHSTYANWAYNRSAERNEFRCAGVNYATGPNPTDPPFAWSHPTVYLKSTIADEASSSFVAAIDTCRAKGGHLPYQRDYAELVSGGLPGGTDTWLWTADNMHGDNTPGYVGVIKWAGVDIAFNDEHSHNTTWSITTTNRGFRCVYYPVDEDYIGPAESDCQGGCYEYSVTVDGVTTAMWTDTFDRSPSVGYGDAVRDCYAKGGHLPTHRDMAEIIRGSAPNGSNQWLWTSDATRYDLTKLVRWNGIDPAWANTNDVLSEDSSRNSTARPYRCVWSNELDR